MSKSRPDIAFSAKRPLADLLRFLVASAGDVTMSGEDPVVLETLDGKTATVPSAVLEHALRLGLAGRRGQALQAKPETRNFIKRLLSGTDGFQDQHRALAERTMEVAAARQPVRVNQLESPLFALSRLKDKAGVLFLPAAAIAAGEQFARDFNRAGLQPRLTMAWEPRLASRTGGELGQAREISDTAAAARQRLQRATEAMGPELSGVAFDVCCFTKGLETVERERQWPARSAKLMLRAALMALSRHYAPEPSSKRHQHAWGAEGYRPDMAVRSGRESGGPA
ncbi:hypothetical protein IB238_02385 [Rhizobium sp. ARZ01]|uniref:DUF6456 domain-containing protein n=1 Tax=Rhizobium sp. ARZ01 TaxID=2769313 RepID=UPI00177AA628|nr:DUF6456 domain-containing protein [Rhizobium sp. ARZ01]MBD9371488.1 hypothetical protein [Rhizobium sp. ARZ01]